MGWRYLLFVLGGITLILWVARFFLFNLMESPRYLIGKGEDEKAVKIIHQLAQYNKKESSLTLDQLKMIEDRQPSEKQRGGKAVLSQTSNYTVGHIKALFRTRKMAYSTSLLISIWGEHLAFILLPRRLIPVERRRHRTCFDAV